MRAVGAVGTLHGGHPGSCGFFRVRRADDIQVRNDTEAGNCFHRLVGGAVFSHGYGVMRQNIGDRGVR